MGAPNQADNDTDDGNSSRSDIGYNFSNVLVDEIDFVHAVERGRRSRNDLHRFNHQETTASVGSFVCFLQQKKRSKKVTAGTPPQSK